MKHSIFSFLLLCLFTACEKDKTSVEPATPQDASVTEPGDGLSFRGKVTICHLLGNGGYNAISVNENAVNAHLNHGDYLPDADGDGYTLIGACTGSGDDCDDGDAGVNPGATETPYNGIDDDCNPATPDDDLDGDGFLLADDCDDGNTAVNPDADEDCDNGIDDDCNGDVDEADSDCVNENLLQVTVNTGSETYLLFMSAEDQNSGYPAQNGIEWGDDQVDIPNLTNYNFNTAAVIQDFDGQDNTAKIVAALGANGGVPYAAKRCDDLVYEGYDDWYLPSMGELVAAYDQLGPGGTGDITAGGFWSSNENRVGNAWWQRFQSGTQHVNTKPDTWSCRCVRKD